METVRGLNPAAILADLREIASRGIKAEPSNSPWKTCRQWAQEWNVSTTHAIRLIGPAVISGAMKQESRKTKLPTGAVRLQPHYAYIGKKSK